MPHFFLDGALKLFDSKELQFSLDKFYMDRLDKQWRHVGQATESSAEFDQLRVKHFLTIGHIGKRIMNLECKIRGKAAEIRHVPDCLFKGIFLRKSNMLYVHGEHTHPMESDGDVPLSGDLHNFLICIIFY